MTTEGLIEDPRDSVAGLGPRDAWPPALRTLVDVMRGSAQPMFVVWGPEQILLYNDAYAQILAAKHPAAYGRPFLEVWHEIRDDLRPIVTEAYAGRPVQMDDIALTMNRRGYPEEAHFAFSYTPVRRDDGAVAGFFCACVETTEAVLAGRRRLAERRRLEQMFEQAPGLIALLDGPDHVFALANATYRRLVGGRDLIGRTVSEALPEVQGQGFVHILDQVFRSGRPFRGEAVRLLLDRGAGDAAEERAEERYIDFIYQPVTDADGRVTGIFVEGNDVTDRKRADSRLRETLAIQTVGVMYWSEGFGLADMNAAFLRMTGFTREEALGMSWAELTPEEFHPVSLKAIEEVTTRGESTPYEKQYFRKDGSRWWGLFAARKIGDEVVEFVLDVTERREAEARLRENEERFRLVVDAADDYAVITLDPDRRVTGWSPGAARAFGYERAEIVGALGDLLFTEADRAAGEPARETATALAQGRAPDIRWHRRKDGSRVFVNGVTHPLRSGEGRHIGFFKIARDETERLRIDEALRETEERYRLAARATNDVVWDWDLETGEVAWNDALRTRFGYAADAVGGSADWWKANIHPEDRDRVVDAIHATAEGAGDHWSAEYRFRRADGSYAHVLDRGAVLRSDGGNAHRMVGAMHDLTERKRAEAELRRLNETLEQRVLDEVASRLKTEEALRQSQKMEAIGQLTGGVAHDFNNLLTVIRGSADLLRRDELSPEKRRRYVEAISDTADRAAKLTGQLLAFARRQALKPEIFNVGDQISAISDMLRTVVGGRIELVSDTDCEPCFVEADSIQFETALVNMAVNARDAMDGEGVLTLKVRPSEHLPRVRGHGEASGAFVSVCIADTGHGIPPERLEHIFEPFFTTKEVGKGTGLGLSQVYGFAKQSGGEIDVASSLGEGTAFTLYLPRVPAPDARDAAAPAAAPDPEPGGRILVVEDNEQVGAFSTQLLAELGYETVWAGNAVEALKRLDEASGDFAAVFSDVVMPGMSGVDLAREVSRRHPGLPVVLTSGYSHILAQEARHGFDLIHKPYSVEDLTRVLRSAIVRRR
ncbi:PAS domain S-box protein [Sphingosinicella terrae]|uniref:PAS domain S-box protein n=1 Tax=Sphingosinicella terrae TaxID=2172047 RepID=UPI0013B392C3|nr:PAS domain S-box protein [Sphingosinicella terrae]